MSLHDELSRLADTAPRPDIDHTVWDRGRALRRRDRLVSSAIVLVMVAILGGLASIVLGLPRAFAPADDTVPDGAIPSRILEPPVLIDPPLEDDLGIGRASVAFYSAGGTPILIGATDGRYHLVKLTGIEDRRGALALSPDGRRLAWATDEPGVSVADLVTGQVLETTYGPRPGSNAVTELRWSPDSTTVFWEGFLGGRERAREIRVGTLLEEALGPEDLARRGLVAPTGNLAARFSSGRAALFVAADGTRLERSLPRDLYPRGASVIPLGWASDHLVLATAEAPSGGYVEGRQLVLFTSPDRPKSEWTFRIVARDLPNTSISMAVDLIPDLDGTSNQQLTHDFGEPDWPAERDISWLIGLGVAGALSVLYGLRWLWRRRTGL